MNQIRSDTQARLDSLNEQAHRLVLRLRMLIAVEGNRHGRQHRLLRASVKASQRAARRYAARLYQPNITAGRC